MRTLLVICSATKQESETKCTTFYFICYSLCVFGVGVEIMSKRVRSNETKAFDKGTDGAKETCGDGSIIQDDTQLCPTQTPPVSNANKLVCRICATCERGVFMSPVHGSCFIVYEIVCVSIVIRYICNVLQYRCAYCLDTLALISFVYRIVYWRHACKENTVIE